MELKEQRISGIRTPIIVPIHYRLIDVKDGQIHYEDVKTGEKHYDEPMFK